MDKKEKLLEIIKRWFQPENQGYRYHIWARNCSTILRDVLDETLDGGLKKRYQTQIGSQSYRQLWSETFGAWSWVAMSLDLLMNREVNQVPTLWEQMFIPERLQSHLESMPALNNQGRVVVDAKFLGPTTQLFSRVSPLPRKGVDPRWILGVLVLMPFLLLWFLVWRGSLGRTSKAFYRLFALPTIVLIAISAMGSVAMILCSIFTLRTYFYLGWHGLVFCFLDLILIFKFLPLIRDSKGPGENLESLQYTVGEGPFVCWYLIVYLAQTGAVQ